jgi:gamma-glutamylcyclotransferase (GGCT)/AIG2-like uncharacterized protein YtfP
MHYYGYENWYVIFQQNACYVYSEIRKNEELLRKALDQLEKVRGEWETVKNDLEAERAMSSVPSTLFELINEHISANVFYWGLQNLR